MTLYHEVGHTLDPRNPIPDDAAPAAGVGDEAAAQIKAAAAEHAEQLKAQAEQAAQQAAEFAARDPKPTPSEMLVETGREPSAEAPAEVEPPKKRKAKES